MAEAERRPGKIPLRKQPEIEEVEESHSQNKDSKDVCVTKMIDTARVNSNSGEEDRSASELVTSSIPVAANGAASAAASGDSSDMTSSLQSMGTELSSPSPETMRKDRPLKVNHSFSSKAKPLMRGTAIDDSVSVPTPEVKVITTPAPDNDDSPYHYNTHVPMPLLGQDGGMVHHRSVLQKNGSLSSDAGTSNCSLSRESSVEKIYKDSSGVDLEEFIKKTLVKSKKDKQMLLNLEKDFRIFVKSEDQHYQLAEMSSYDRMICHRVAAFYGMDHNIDKSGKCVIVSKTKFTRIPTFSCDEYIRTVEPEDSGSERKQMRLLKKPASMEERSRGGDKAQFSSHRTKSLEERQRHYDEKRKIIFGQASEEGHGVPVIDSVPTSNAPYKRLSSRDWSSTDSSGYVSEDGSRLRRGLMAKSNSYGDSITSGTYESAPVRTKQASPENSQSPISGSGRSSADVNSPSQVQPHTNADGSPYRYNPNDPHNMPAWLSGSGGGPPTNPSQHHHQPSTSHMGYNHLPSLQSVQYTISGQQNELCNRFSNLDVSGGGGAPPSMDTLQEGGQQQQQQPQMMTALGHHHHPSQSHPHHHHHHHHPPSQQVAQAMQQPTNQLPLMVSAAMSMQPSQQFITSFPAGATPQGQNYYTGAQVQFVHVDAQGQCVPVGPGPSQSTIVSYSQPHLLQTASTLQPAILDQSTVGGYGQSVYSPGEAGSSYCVPAYMTPANSMVYPGGAPTTHYPTNGMHAMAAPGGASHYGAFNAPQQSSSPQLATFAPLQTAHMRPATPPNLSIGQPVGYHHPPQQGLGLGHGVSSTPQMQPGAYYATPQPHPFSTQGQPVGQVMQVSMRGGGGGVGVPVSTPHHPHMSHPGGGQQQQQHNLQHSQSFPVLRQVPPTSTGPNPLTLGPAPNPAPTPPQHHQHPHPMISVKSLSMGSIRGAVGGGAATPDKETAPGGGMGVGYCGGGSFMGGGMAGSGATMQFPGQLMAPGMRQPQPGDLRVVGAASLRPQMAPSLITIQPGQPVRNNRSSGPRQSRPPRRNNSNAGSSNNAAQTTASASVARVMSLDTGSALHQPINRP